MPTRWQYKSEQGRKNHVDTNQQHSDQDQAEKENESSHQNECVPRNKRIDSMDKPCSRTDREFDLTVEMMVNDFDDERTLDEEEALENQEDHATELSDLQREGDMPLDQLLAMYGCGDAQSDEASSEGEKPEPTALRRLYDDKPEGVTRQNSEEVGTVPGPEEEDGDYSPDEDEWRKTIMVGSDYQASIPEGLCRYGDALPYENEDKLLWNPVQLTEQEVEDFLVRAQETNAQGIAAIPTGAHTRDDEQALYLLLQCGYNVEEALRRRRMNLVSP